MDRSNIKPLIMLHVFLLFYSLSGVCSKLAGQQAFMSLPFILYYGGLIALLGLYALGWQQALKKLPLTTAYANKAVTVVWGIVLGTVFFGEAITLGKIVGAVVIICGVVLFVRSDMEDGHA